MEIWKDIYGYEGYYQVSSFGNVRSLDRYVNLNYGLKRIVKGKNIKKNISNTGYLRCQLNIKNSSKHFSIHRLVAVLFVPNYKKKLYVNHINGIKTDNHYKNLEWVSISENTKHAYNEGFIKKKLGEKHHLSKIKEIDVYKIKFETSHLRNFEVAKIFNISKEHVKSIRNNYTWKHVVKKSSNQP
jgi:hypothetical protein